jgi:hypothetical protein
MSSAEVRHRYAIDGEFELRKGVVTGRLVTELTGVIGDTACCRKVFEFRSI